MYCIDTSALVDGWIRYYPPDVFPPLWTKLEDMIHAKQLIAPDEVLTELSKKEDDLRTQSGDLVDVLHRHQCACGRLDKILSAGCLPTAVDQAGGHDPREAAYRSR